MYMVLFEYVFIEKTSEIPSKPVTGMFYVCPSIHYL